MGRQGTKDYITPVVNESVTPTRSKDFRTIRTRISNCLVLFSLYGNDVDAFLEKFLEFRAIDQKLTADTMVEKVFKAIFKPSSRPFFNLLINLEKKLDF